MENLIEINKAIEVLRDLCKSTESCEDCIFNNTRGGRYINCMMENSPDNWKEIL